MSFRIVVLAAALVIQVGSCGGISEPLSSGQCPDDNCAGGEMTVAMMGIFHPKSADLLIVLDDSVPSGPGAAALDRGLREMMKNLSDGLASMEWGVDLNVALVPATAGSQSLWPASPGCPQPTDPYLRASQRCSVPSNFTGELADTVACAAQQIVPSGGAPRPVAALHAALKASPETGFRRAGVPLYLVIVSSQDDPSLFDAEQVAKEHDFLAGLVTDPENPLALGIVAPSAAQGLAALAASIPTYRNFSDFADEAWPALSWTTTDFGWREWWPSCLDGIPVDVDPAVDGIQPNCTGTEIRLFSTTFTERPLPPCAADQSDAGACWRIAHDMTHCWRNGLGFEFRVDAPRPTCMPDYAVRYSLTCAVRYDDD